MLAVGTILQNRYLIVHKIGQGGMGAVYEAKDQRLNVTVALKETIVSGDTLHKAFEREARLLAKLRHSALPVVSDYFFEGDGQYLVMQYIDGKDLGQLLVEKGKFPLVEVLTWAEQLLNALDYLHSQQPPIIHRDIKPSNLKLTERNQIILLDFGLAKGNTTVVQNTGANAGANASVYGYSPHYAPIEQIEGTGTDVRSDMYALAATLYHLMTGVRPADAMPRVLSILNGQIDPLRPASEVDPKIPISVSNVLANVLSQKRDERPATIAIMRTMLENAVREASDPSLLVALNSTVKLNSAVRTSEQLPLITLPTDNSEAETLLSNPTQKAPKPNTNITDPKQSAEQTQLATQANNTQANATKIDPTVNVIKNNEINTEKNSKKPFLVAIATVAILAFIIVGVLFVKVAVDKNKVSVNSVNSALASKDQKRPTQLAAKEILGYGLDAPCYYDFTAEAGEIKLVLNVVSNGATITVEAFDKDLKPITFKDNQSFSLTASNNQNEQLEAVILNPIKQKITLKLSNNYPKDLRAYRLRLSGEIELVPLNKKDNENSGVKALDVLAKEFEDRDNPFSLTTDTIINRGTDKDVYYSFDADIGEIKLTLNVVSNGATVSVKVFDSNSKPVRYSNSSDFSLASTNYQNEKANVVIQNDRKQTFLLRISNNYPNDLRAYRLNLKGPIKFSKGGKDNNKFASLLAEFKDRDEPKNLLNNEIINSGSEKDSYYSFRVQPGELKLTLDLIADGSTVSVQIFDSEDKLMNFADNNTKFSLASTNHNERKDIILRNSKKQSVLMRINHTYATSIKAYRLRLDGAVQIINPDPNANKAFESLAKLFNDRDKPVELKASEISGVGSEKDLYYTFSAGAGELKLNLSLMAEGGSVAIELFDKDNKPIVYKDNQTSFSLTSNNKNEQKAISAQINEKQNIVIRITNAYPTAIKEYKLELSGAINLSQEINTNTSVQSAGSSQ